MNKGDLIEAVAQRLGESKASVSRSIEAVIDCIKDGVKDEDSVTIAGFGTFQKKTRAARTVRNPSTGEPIRVKESTTVAFKPSKTLKETFTQQQTH